ncbi:glycerophosphodiester phosphodiesterase [Paenibacillus nasutitermitis]|uniref:GP-PDE domain-containing protein n=1 Tax=Paenibacillus nasutitermitis TaxID=1652958 RepID=A0A917DT22_9BACL|nr:glycerophosphodiester phosphodiesterase family protein [Paenibacillus nasutitermitis]GGD64472.1 hypothetical protein GCM10010911_22790 [Paenibacillus nasutitermitis]
MTDGSKRNCTPGYSGRYPENTIAAFQAACELEFTHLELDVHLSKDGIPMVLHDKTLDRMTDGKGLVKDYTSEVLSRFRVGGTEVIPTLEEVLLLLKDRLIVRIEISKRENCTPDWSRRYRMWCARRGCSSRCM